MWRLKVGRYLVQLMVGHMKREIVDSNQSLSSLSLILDNWKNWLCDVGIFVGPAQSMIQSADIFSPTLL